MDNSIYIAVSRQLALFRDLEATANNIANTNTVGYGSEHILFDSYLTKDVNQGERNDMAFANPAYSYRNLATGSMAVTGNDLDMAIQGEGYFQVQTPLGIRYTRAGNFQRSGEGILITPDGHPVLDASGQIIQFPEDTQTITVGELGNIKANGEDFANLGIVMFENPQLLERLGSKLYASEVAPLPAEGVRVLQGTLEGSNVQPVLEMTHMIEVSRSVESTAQLIASIYDLERKAATAWAKPAQ